jgi:hypothetical protein
LPSYVETQTGWTGRCSSPKRNIGFRKREAFSSALIEDQRSSRTAISKRRKAVPLKIKRAMVRLSYITQKV